MPHLLKDLAQTIKETDRKVCTGKSLRARSCAWLSSLVKPLISILTLSLAATATLSAETLETANPFLPPGYGEKKPEAPTPVVQKNGPISREIEFRGVLKINGKYQFSVFNKSEKKSYWISENQAESGISIRGYEADSHTLTVNMNGRSEQLTLISASDSPLPVISSVNQANKPSNASNTNLPPNLENLTNNNNDRRRVVPRRRVILPKK
jgi:hypothetical protein